MKCPLLEAEGVKEGSRKEDLWKQRYEQWGYEGLLDRRRHQPSPQRVPLEVVRQVLTLYRERYFDLNVLPFPEKHQTEHGLPCSST